MPPRCRPRSAHAQQATKFRKIIKDGADEFLCPITQELPVDPVIAGDGRVYERAAITKWLNTNSDTKSPYTNEPMERMLLPAIQVKNLIRSMVQSGEVSDDKSCSWKKKLAEEQDVENMKRRAEEGDTTAMKYLAKWYSVGFNGLKVDYAESYKWIKHAADHDDPEGISDLGFRVYHGLGTTQDTTLGNMLCIQAATMGVDYSCWLLTQRYLSHSEGLSRDLERARYWAKKALDKTHIKVRVLDKATYDQLARWAKELFDSGLCNEIGVEVLLHRVALEHYQSCGREFELHRDREY